MIQTEINNELKILVEKYINELQIIKSNINVKKALTKPETGVIIRKTKKQGGSPSPAGLALYRPGRG